MYRISAVCAVLGLLVLAVSVARGQAGGPRPCDPGTPSKYTLVAPEALPEGFPGGYYLERNRVANPRGVPSTRYIKATVEPAGQGPVAHGYRDWGTGKRGYDWRWPLVFGRGDGPARVTVRFDEDFNGIPCERTLTAFVRPAQLRDPRLRLRRPRRRGRHVVLSGSTRRGPRRPLLVALEQYLDAGVYDFRRVRARNGRFHARFPRVFDDPRERMYRFRARALYPGDVRQTWPCDDIWTTGTTDDCRRRLTRPPDSYFFYYPLHAQAWLLVAPRR